MLNEGEGNKNDCMVIDLIFDKSTYKGEMMEKVWTQLEQKKNDTKTRREKEEKHNFSFFKKMSTITEEEVECKNGDVLDIDKKNEQDRKIKKVTDEEIEPELDVLLTEIFYDMTMTTKAMKY